MVSRETSSHSWKLVKKIDGYFIFLRLVVSLASNRTSFSKFEGSGNSSLGDKLPRKAFFSHYVLSFSWPLFKGISLAEKCKFIIWNTIFICNKFIFWQIRMLNRQLLQEEKKPLLDILIYMHEIPRSTLMLTGFFAVRPGRGLNEWMNGSNCKWNQGLWKVFQSQRTLLLSLRGVFCPRWTTYTTQHNIYISPPSFSPLSVPSL